jgi:glucose-6-phosphate isomerase
MLDVLMNPKSVGPNVHYFMIRGGSERKNITIWQSGTVGGEYIKTYGHYHVKDFSETYTVLSGEGIILLQERKKGPDGVPIDDEVEYVKAIFVKTGSKVPIPPRAGHLAVNTGDSWLVTSDDSPVNFEKAKEAAWPVHADYASVKKMHGFAYYIVKKDGKPVFVKNPNYKNTPDIVTESR